jgi:type III restriction enzyme
MATGSGKTKVMSLAIVWSYFHALREPESTMARHFVVIAPNLTVFERLKEDFRPEEGGADIFDRDPLIPSEWRSDWNLTVVLQDEAGGAATEGVLYLTNIHRLYDPAKRSRDNAETYDWMGPPVSKSKALDTGAVLRDRITEHDGILVLNDEAHHLWDPDSSWNEAVTWLHETSRARGGRGVMAQLDFSATPKDNRALPFRHIVCDAPLGEAVDGGIVKTPIIGRAGDLVEQASDDAGVRYQAHLLLGYQRWWKSHEEWAPSGKKPLMFVMCADTKAADEITRELNQNALFKELNGRTINLHTNLKGKLKKLGKGTNATYEFVANEKEISDEDLKALRKLSRELDSGASPYRSIVSVLMLREGWDVRNVTTIVPLRPYTSKAGILPEQTLGRGLRRMTPPGQAQEIVAVVEHNAFARLYREELAQEGLPLAETDADKVPNTTVSIFPDPKKDLEALEIAIPRLHAAHEILPVLGPISEDEVRKAFAKYKPLELGKAGPTEVPYEGRHLITQEVVEQMKVNLPLLESGVGAVSFYVKEIEYICKVRGTHAVLAPLIQVFFEEILFGPGRSIFSADLVKRLSASDVRENVRAVFVPLVRGKTLLSKIRQPEAAPRRMSEWKPYPATVNERRPVLPSGRTLFNLVPCNQALEQGLVEFLDKAEDVVAFAKNAGPQALRIDYLSGGERLAFYTQDFFVRTPAGHYLVETKGQVDRDVPRKARAAVEWCKSASKENATWQYVYIAEGVFLRFSGSKFAELVAACEPALKDLMDSPSYAAEAPLFAAAGIGAMEGYQEELPIPEVLDPGIMRLLPERSRRSAEEAIALYAFSRRKPNASFAPLFTPLLGPLDAAARSIVASKLEPHLPPRTQDQKAWFTPYLAGVDTRMHKHFQEMAQNLKKTLVFQNGVSPIGLLRNCLDHARQGEPAIPGVFQAVRTEFASPRMQTLLEKLQFVNDFRNTRVAHQSVPLTDVEEARDALARWIKALASLCGEAKRATTATAPR